MSKSHDYVVGSKCFYDGEKMLVQAVDGEYLYVWPWHADPGTWSMKRAHYKQVEPLVVDTFEIGDEVESCHYHFRGVVVALDFERNEVICKSNHPEPKGGERARWAYKPSDLIRTCDKRFRFRMNGIYKVVRGDNCFRVRALPHPTSPEIVVLYRVDNGEYYRCVATDRNWEIPYESARDDLSLAIE